MGLEKSVGKPIPIGVRIGPQEVNFAIFSKHATEVSLSIVEPATKKEIGRYSLDPNINKTGDIWHIAIEGLSLPVCYCYYMNGNKVASNSYDPSKPLLDPYAKELDTSLEWEKKLPYPPMGVISSANGFDWQGVAIPNIPVKDLRIYEMHVRGFTNHPSSGVKNKGKYLGIIEKIPHLVDLGINAVELLPVFEFDETRNPRKDPTTNRKLCNFWGYATVNFFCPMNRYATVQGKAKEEFQTMVRELHRNHIEVILDVVFNHTGEVTGKELSVDRDDDYLSFLGIDKQVYYLLSHDQHTNYSGCGNTMNLNHPVVQNFVIDCLHYWATEMRVDGFRFDLATIMNRGMHGELLAESPLIQRISHDPILSQKKLIAEPWDAANGYQLGGFLPKQNRWSEWNDQFKTDVRKFVKGDPISKKALADRVSGSNKNFHFRSPQASINFITAHDGFTLADLVSYNQKHNESNGEQNQDGDNNMNSWNCGAEGETKDPAILRLREKQQLNFYVILFLSFGVPMMLMGDEYGHSKKGNNNTYCHDDDLNYFQWDKIDPKRFSFIQKLIQLRKEHPIFSRDTFPQAKDITWHGLKPSDPNWEDPHPVLGWKIVGKNAFFIFINPTDKPYDILLPRPLNTWHLVINTDAPGPESFYNIPDAPSIKDNHYLIPSHTSIVLIDH